MWPSKNDFGHGERYRSRGNGPLLANIRFRLVFRRPDRAGSYRIALFMYYCYGHSVASAILGGVHLHHVYGFLELFMHSWESGLSALLVTYGMRVLG